MVAEVFNILDWLSGLTPYLFEKAVLKNVALEQGVSEITAYSEITESQRDHCEIALLTRVYFGPNTMAGSTHTHGAFSVSVGQQQVTADSRERILARIKQLAAKYGEEDKLIPDDAINVWVDETGV